MPTARRAAPNRAKVGATRTPACGGEQAGATDQQPPAADAADVAAQIAAPSSMPMATSEPTVPAAALSAPKPGRRAGTGRSRRSRRGRSPRARRSRPRGPGRGARWRVRVGRSSRGSCRRVARVGGSVLEGRAGRAERRDELAGQGVRGAGVGSRCRRRRSRGGRRPRRRRGTRARRGRCRRRRRRPRVAGPPRAVRRPGRPRRRGPRRLSSSSGDRCGRRAAGGPGPTTWSSRSRTGGRRRRRPAPRAPRARAPSPCQQAVDQPGEADLVGLLVGRPARQQDGSRSAARSGSRIVC